MNTFERDCQQREINIAKQYAPKVLARRKARGDHYPYRYVTLYELELVAPNDVIKPGRGIQIARLCDKVICGRKL